jgi:integrase
MSRTAPEAPVPAVIVPDSPGAAEFLVGGDWHAREWTFTPTNALELERPVRIRWDFALPGGGRFTDARFAPLLQVSRRLLATIRRRGGASGLPQRATTVLGYFSYLRTLVRFMDASGIVRFADLDASALRQFQRQLEGRSTRQGRPVSPITVQKYLDLLRILYHYRSEIGDGLSVDPCPGGSTGFLAGVGAASQRSWPYTPDPVAIALIRGATDYLEGCAVDLLRARELYAHAVATVKQRGHTPEVWRKASARVLRSIVLTTPRGDHRLASAAELAEFIDVLYVACFVVIGYLVGLRASELLHLQSGCLKPLPDAHSGADTGLMVIQGTIFKREPGFHGRPHQWVAPPPAAHAIAVLEALSAPHRARDNRAQLWLRARPGHHSGASEWQVDSQARLRVLSSGELRALIERCAPWFELPTHEGKRWKLSTHQGRKTFVRFAALRDRSALLALAQHLGHRERAITDQGYVGSDYRLNQEIDAAILEQSVGAWEQMLSADRLGGRAGAEILAQRPRFRGTRMKQDLKRYARTLVDAGLTLGVCDWGFCVYRQQHSACLGTATAPNPVRREPSTCARCQNFTVTQKHRGYWLEQARRCEALLNEPALPTQTLKIARMRLSEALTILRSLDANGQRADIEQR